MIVSLPEMLDARERRANRQRELLEKFQKPLVSFTMNIAGPIKDTPLIRRGFDIGLEDLEQVLNRDRLVAVWPELMLPLRVLEMWQSRFPALRRAPVA